MAKWWTRFEYVKCTCKLEVFALGAWPFFFNFASSGQCASLGVVCNPQPIAKQFQELNLFSLKQHSRNILKKRVHEVTIDYVTHTHTHTHTHIHRVFWKELCSCIPNAVSRVLRKRKRRSTLWAMDSLYAFKCKHFHNPHHTVAFGIPL
jgi:hypothetical protein